MSERFLVVRAGGERYGLALAHVREVVDVATPRPVPARAAAVRGVMQLRERHLSLVHLAAFLRGGPPPSAVGDTAVVVDVQGTVLALEVDDVEDVVDRAAVWVGEAPAAWASGVWRVGEGLVTVLDLAVLVDRLEGAEAREAAAGARTGGAG